MGCVPGALCNLLVRSATGTILTLGADEMTREIRAETPGAARFRHVNRTASGADHILAYAPARLTFTAQRNLLSLVARVSPPVRFRRGNFISGCLRRTSDA